MLLPSGDSYNMTGKQYDDMDQTLLAADAFYN